MTVKAAYSADVNQYPRDAYKIVPTQSTTSQIGHDSYFSYTISTWAISDPKNINESVLNESTLPEGLSDLLFDVIDDYKNSCEFFEDSLEYVESIIDYTISRAVSQEIIEPTSDEYIDSLYDVLYDNYTETLMSEYEAICENND